MAVKKKKKIEVFFTPVARLSWPNLLEPREDDGKDDNGKKKKPKYDCQLIFEPAKFSDTDKERWALMKKAMDKRCQETFGCNWSDLRTEVEGAKIGLRSGKKKPKEQGYGEGTQFFNCSTTMKPGLCTSTRNDDGKFINVNEEEGNTDLIYPGGYWRGRVTIYCYDNKGQGLSFGLRSLQFVKNGPRLDSQADASEDFDGEEEFIEEEDDEFENESPKKKKKKRPVDDDEDDSDDSDDDEDAAPKKKKKRPVADDDDDSDDDEDEAPKKKKKRPVSDDDDSDDDEDDAPKKKKKRPAADDDDDDEDDDSSDEDDD